MGEGRPRSTPSTPQTTTGSATETHGANTNLDPKLQGGPATAQDRAKTEEITDEHAQQGVPNGQE